MKLHHTMRAEHVALSILALTLFCGSQADAQQLTVGSHKLIPGERTTFVVSFSGPGADDVQRVEPFFLMNTPVRQDQPGFLTQFGGAPATASSPRHFEPSVMVPAHAATGDYRLQITAVLKVGSVMYTSGAEFTLLLKVDNPEHVPVPTIEVTVKLGAPVKP